MFVGCLIQAPTFSRWHTKTHAGNNRCHSERDYHRSTTTQLWNAEMSTSSNHIKAFVQCCHGKHAVASSRTFLFDHVLEHITLNCFDFCPFSIYSSCSTSDCQCVKEFCNCWHTHTHKIFVHSS